MPANYAHYRFGKQLLSGMCPNDRRSIQRFRRLYDMGLHGPDIFFYYNPLIKTATGQLGGVFHAQSGQEFFARVCAQAGSEAGRVYLLGLLGHYCLDSLCHPYVEKKEADGSARHVELESEFDRYLLEADGVVLPHTYDGSAHMRHNEALSERESQILRLVADGLSNREIAEQLFLSRYTVESHVKRIYRKLAVSSRTMAVRAARQRGVIG